MERLLKKYNIDAGGADYSAYYVKAKDALVGGGAEIMNFEKYGIFTYMKDDIAKIRDELLTDADNALYCYFLAEAVKADDKKAIGIISKPKWELESELYDTLPLFGLLWCVPDMIAAHKRLGIPDDVTVATCGMFENQIQDYINLNHRYGISTYCVWMSLFLNCKIFRIGRFNLELMKCRFKYDVFESGDKLAIMPKDEAFHASGYALGSAGYEDADGSFVANLTETDEYFEGCPIVGGLCQRERVRLYKNEWTRVLTEGDDIVSVHIPSGGAMSPDVCDADLARGNEIISRCIVKPKAFFCCSWLLDGQLEGIIGKPTNITRFGDRFERFPIKDSGASVFEYVFMTSPDTPIDELPETNSLTKAIKKHLKSGGHIYETRGVFLV